jgi:hypothetical protein
VGVCTVTSPRRLNEYFVEARPQAIPLLRQCPLFQVSAKIGGIQIMPMIFTPERWGSRPTAAVQVTDSTRPPAREVDGLTGVAYSGDIGAGQFLSRCEGYTGGLGMTQRSSFAEMKAEQDRMTESWKAEGRASEAWAIADPEIVEIFSSGVAFGIEAGRHTRRDPAYTPDEWRKALRQAVEKAAAIEDKLERAKESMATKGEK